MQGHPGLGGSAQQLQSHAGFAARKVLHPQRPLVAGHARLERQALAGQACAARRRGQVQRRGVVVDCGVVFSGQDQVRHAGCQRFEAVHFGHPSAVHRELAHLDDGRRRTDDEAANGRRLAGRDGEAGEVVGARHPPVMARHRPAAHADRLRSDEVVRHLDQVAGVGVQREEGAQEVARLAIRYVSLGHVAQPARLIPQPLAGIDDVVLVGNRLGVGPHAVEGVVDRSKHRLHQRLHVAQLRSVRVYQGRRVDRLDLEVDRVPTGPQSKGLLYDRTACGFRHQLWIRNGDEVRCLLLRGGRDAQGFR